MGKIKIILPDFIIIGANKAGTTSVAHYLNQHPEIKISTIKEPMFFSSNIANVSADKNSASLSEPYFVSNIEEYSSMFTDHSESTKFFGEASTSYLASPTASARLMKKIVPNVKIIVILREPSARAVSAFKMCNENGIENRSFHEISELAIKNKVSVLHAHGVRQYIRNGLYGQLLLPYFKFFDNANLLFLKYDDLVLDADTFMTKIVAFIGGANFQFETSIKHNTAGKKSDAEFNITVDSLAHLKTFYQEDIAKTEELTGLDLSNWKV